MAIRGSTGERALVSAELLGLLLALGMGGEALAQALPETPKEGGASDVSELSLEELLNLEVVTASAQAQTVSEAPSTVYVFTAETIRRRGYTYLAQLLEDVPEIEMHFKARPEYSEQIIVRGILGVGNEKIIHGRHSNHHPERGRGAGRARHREHRPVRHDRGFVRRRRKGRRHLARGVRHAWC
jgi:hypothetical protein